MVFSVKYRDSSGAVCEKAVEAANRADCFAKCKAQGIAPMSVRTGVKGKEVKVKSFRIGVRGVALGLVFAGVIGAGIWCFTGRNEIKAVKAPEQKIVKPSKKLPKEVAPAANSVSVAVEKTEDRDKKEFKVKRYGRSSNVPVEDTNRIHYASNGGLKIVGEDGVARTVRSKPIFKNRFDNMMWAAIRPGGMPSGLNALRNRMRFQTGSDEAFFQALRNHEITIEPDDPPHIVTAKNLTIEVKDTIVKEMDAGRSFDELYREICQTTKKERSYERIAQEEYRKVLQSKDPEAVRKYVEDMNPVMQEMGLKEMRIPSWANEAPQTEQ